MRSLTDERKLSRFRFIKTINLIQEDLKDAQNAILLTTLVMNNLIEVGNKTDEKFPARNETGNWNDKDSADCVQDFEKLRHDIKKDGLRGKSPLHEIYGYYISTEDLLKTLTVRIAANEDGTPFVFNFEGEENYIVSFLAGEDAIDRRLIPASTEPHKIEMLMTEMLARAKDNFRDAYRNLVKDSLKPDSK